MKRLPMRRIREVLRLAAQGLSQVGRTTLREYIYRARSAGLSWPLPDDVSDGDLERMLFPRSAGDVRGSFAQLDWAYIHAELRRKGVTLALLWEECRRAAVRGLCGCHD
jgi:transposase